MGAMIKAELLKQKHTFQKKLICIAPLVTMLISFLLMGMSKEYIQVGAFNWWYTIILPGALTLITSFIVANDKKRKFHGLFSIVIDLKEIWYSKIIVSSIYLALTCLIFFLGSTILGMFFGNQIPVLNSLIASVLLFILFLWQIPLWMFISMKITTGFSLILSIICNCGIGAICAIKSTWWIPFAIPSRVMCKAIGIMPNGLLVEPGSSCTNENIIPLAIFISIVLDLVLSYFSAKWFEK